MGAAASVVTGRALVAGPAGEEHLYRHAVAGGDPPSFGRGRADLLNDSDRLVAWDEGEAGCELSRVLLVVGPAKAARFDPQDAIALADLGQR